MSNQHRSLRWKTAGPMSAAPGVDPRAQRTARERGYDCDHGHHGDLHGGSNNTASGTQSAIGGGATNTTKR